jgi:hypothetical protein
MGIRRTVQRIEPDALQQTQNEARDKPSALRRQFCFVRHG